MEEKAPLAPAIREMKPGDTLTFPIERMRSVDKAVYEANLLFDGKYTASRSRKEKTITITRTA